MHAVCKTDSWVERQGKPDKKARPDDNVVKVATEKKFNFKPEQQQWQ